MTSLNTLWMGDLEPYMDETLIAQSFTKMGDPCVGAKLIKNKLTGAPQGYCFVEFHTEEAARRALLRLNGKFIPDTMPPKRYKLNHATYGKEQVYTPEYSIFVGDLTDDVDDLTLYSAFSMRYPSVKGAKVVLDFEGKSKGYGFVRFGSDMEHNKALVEMQNSYGVGGKRIRVSIATPRKPPSNSSTTTSSPSQTHSQYGYGHQLHQQNQQTPTQQTTAPDYSAQWADYYAQYYGTDQYSSSWGTEGATDDSQYQYQEEVEEQPPAQQAEEEEELEEISNVIDVELENEKYMQESEELFTSLEASRWHPIDVTSKLGSVSQCS